MPPALRCPTSFPATSCAKQLCKTAHSSRSFSTTPPQNQRTTRARRALFMWLATKGENFKNPLPGSTNYLGAYNNQGQLRRVVEAEAEKAKHRRNGEEETFKVAGANKDDEIPKETVRDLAPFPLNRSFISQAVLSEELREEIWRRIMIEGKSVREVSAELSVEMSRVGAVVRLMEVEKEWKRIGKPLARPYAKAVMSMLPSTPYDAERGIPYDPVRERKIIHESINDLPVHASTGQQIFHPTSESRQFTRADAAKVFNEKLLPADERIPHPELVLQHREVLAGLSRQEREERARAREEEAEAKQLKAAMVKAKKDAKTKKFETPRWEFRFTEANVDATGKDGRGYKGVGWRYGVPLYDRSRGQIKIPKAVE